MNINLINDLKIELAYRKESGVDTLEFNYLYDRFYPQQEAKILASLKELAKDKFIFINYRAEFIFIIKKVHA